MEAATFSYKKKPPQQPPSFSNNGGGGYFSSTTSYDDVFGGPPKFTSSSSNLAPRAEDYSEIFGGFRTSSSSRASSSSSIPVLDLPAVNSADFHSVLDYSDVFGGLSAVDFAVPFYELFRSSDGCDVSSDEAWTPIGTESLSDDSDPFAFSEKSQRFSNGDFHQPFESNQFSVSYHKVNPGTSTCLQNTMHVDQLDDVPTYTCVVNEASSLREMGKETFDSLAVDDIVLNVDAPPVLPTKQTRKIMPHLSDDGAGLKSFESDRRSGRGRSASMSHVSSLFAPVSEGDFSVEPSHLPQPFRPPALPAERNGNHSGLISGPKVSGKCDLEATVESSLPPFFDMEVDASSSAAASAAAMKDAMDRAQAKLKAAKEFRGRKDTFQSIGKLGLKTDVNGGENVEMAFNGCVSEESRAQIANAEGISKIKNSAKARHAKNASQVLPDIPAVEQPTAVSGQLGLKTDVNGAENAEMTFSGCVSEESRVQTSNAKEISKIKNSDKARHARNASQILPDIPAVEQPTGVTGQPAETKHGKKCSLSMDNASVEVAGEWKEAKQYYEFVNNDNTRSGPQQPCSDDGKKATPKQQDNDDNNSDSAGEVFIPEENRRRLKATKAVSRQEYYEKMVKVAQEVHDTVIGGNAGTDIGLNDVSQRNQKEQKPKLVYEQEKNDGKVWEAQRAEGELSEGIKAEEAEGIKSEDVLENEEMKKAETEACHREQNGRKTDGPHQSMVNEAPEIKEGEKRVRGLCDKEENESREAVVMEGNEQKSKEAYERQRGESEVAEAFKQKKGNERREVKYKQSKGGCEDVFGGERLQTAYEGQEKDKAKDLQKIKVVGNRLKEASGDVFVGERLQRTCESQEHDNAIDLQRSYEYKNLLEEAIDGRGSEKRLNQYIDLDMCWESMEALDQAKARQSLDETPKPIVKNSKESKKRDENPEKLDKTAEEEKVESKCMQAGELGESGKIHENTGDKEDQNGESRSCTNIEPESEDRKPDSSANTESRMEDKNVKLSNSANLGRKDVEVDALSFKLKMPNRNAYGSQEESALKENSEIGAARSDEESKFKAVDTTAVLIDERKKGSTEVSRSDNELERATVHTSCTLHINDKNTKLGRFYTENVHTPKEENIKVAQSVSDSKLGNHSILEQGGKIRNLSADQVVRNQEEKVSLTQDQEMNGRNGHVSKKEVPYTVISDRKETIQKRSQLPNISQSIESKGNIINHNCAEEKDEDKRRDLEMDRLRKLEEEREREREREKDRMAVEIAIREARERAYADARDRAERATLERATDEARQRAMAEARERLEKACAEARERSVADKSSEARLRAERAAVERATAEARQRAIEKAMAERANFEARERMQRSVSEKYTSERDVIMRQSSFPSTSERSEAANGEPAQRCKARLERHRRTVERVANALAEKNTRDLLAQREQAERSRFAETLDADIKRWSNGKERNLRALLSTLQYILGPDSGWQPIPLTEVITAAAVKKAYRKATLCVHPDKLQQRGASIQQKYICEKVFDLLKEAWNRFNSEEK